MHVLEAWFKFLIGGLNEYTLFDWTYWYFAL